ncbi:MAG: class I SAM-dependent DNA methyltransferase [Kiritimatiellia bacterium]
MALSWNEIKSRAMAFSKEWENETSEDAEAKSFWDGFFNVFGISRKRVASFEEPVRKLGERQGFMDLFWKGVLLVEHKSRGKDLDRAFTQALDYFPGIAERDLPKYVLVSDFARFRLYDLEADEQHEFALKDLHKNVRLFGFIAGYQTHKLQEQDPVNIRAAERMGKLHDQLKAVGYEGHPLELYLVRLLFCLFADDTGIFERQQFQEYIERRTGEDGTDLAHHIGTLFQILNTPPEKRLKNLDEEIAAFPFINGKLFEELLPAASFDSAMRQSLLDCFALDWSRISPAIFGSLFQSIMDKTARRNLGAHYTSEQNILKLIKPLFLDGLREDFEKIKNNRNKLADFHKKLESLTFLDPACGCGNFLVIAYRELRLLELDLLRASRGAEQMTLDVHSLIKLNVNQFYGIEIEEFPSLIAQVALWLMDHQMNMLVSEEFGQYFARIPLRSSANIVRGNALRIDWNDVVPASKLSYIMGNPPFVGHHYQNEQQKTDQAAVLHKIAAHGVLDYVANWYVKATELMQRHHFIQAAFVSTNSITQGEQVGILWPLLLSQGIRINFAHRTFQWNNEARGKAAVHCVIVGFAMSDRPEKWLFEYENIKGEPLAIKAGNINPYLVDASDVVLSNRSSPICNVPKMSWGNKPSDGGHLILSDEERADFLLKEPKAAGYIHRYVSGSDLIDNNARYCLWINDLAPDLFRGMPEVMKRVDAVKRFRQESKAASTREYAKYPTRFRQVAQPDSDYLAIPEVSSERRHYIPIAYLSRDIICSNTIQFIPKATLYHFGVINSVMHMAWMRTVCGRLKSDYRYSNTIVYNNFPWPENVSEKQKAEIEKCAQAVLDARAQFPESSLADLYDPLTMPPVLMKAHQALDKAVDAAYGRTTFKTEAERVAFLFELYQKYTSLLPPEKVKKARKTKKKSEEFHHEDHEVHEEFRR